MSSEYLKICEGDAVQFTIHDIIGSSVAVLGSPGSGKSNTNARIIEQIRPFVPVHILDIHNEYYGLAEKFEFLRVGKGKDDGTPPLHIEAGVGQAAEIAEYAYTNGLSVIVQMLYMSPDERLEFTHLYCQKLWELNLIPKKPLAVLLEEAHNFIPQMGANTPALVQLKQFASEGRKFGFTVILSSQRAVKVHNDVLGDCGFAFLQKANIHADFQQYGGMTPYSTSEIKAMFLGKKRGEGMQRGEALIKFMHNGDTIFERAHVLMRETFHVGKTPGLDVVPKVELKMTDTKVVEQLQTLLVKAAEENKPEDKSADKIEAENVLIAKLREELKTAMNTVVSKNQTIKLLQDEIKLLKKPPAPAPVQQTLPTIKTVNVPASIPVPVKDWDGRSELATTRQLNKEKRQFEAIMTDIRNFRKQHKVVLTYLTQREDFPIDERTLAKNTAYSLQTLRLKPLVDAGWVKRTLNQNHTLYLYQSKVRDKFKTMFPALDVDELIKPILSLEKV